MKSINDTLAMNLKAMREQRKLSLDGLAKMTGVSKSMLAQIERGEANPTITVAWKIANGLKISFTELITRPEKDFETVELAQVPVLVEEDGRCRNYPIFSYADSRQFEMYYIELDSGVHLKAEPHPLGTQEFITVFSGEVEIHVNGEILTASKERAVRFKGDSTHSYKSIGEETCCLSMVISYTGNGL